MELLILLIVVAMLAGIVLGPIGFFRSLGADRRLARMDAEVDRLSIEVQSLRTLCLRLMRERQPRQAVSERGAAPSSTEAPRHVKTPIQSDPVVEEAVEEPKPEEPTTLEHLMALRKTKEEISQVEQIDTEPVPQTPPVTEREASIAVEPVREAEPYASSNEPTRRLTVEEVLAGKVFVWIGAVALVLTGAFLLKIGFSEGIITPRLCVISAGVLGLAMWGVGEWMHRRVSLIAQALCGAAVAVLYGSIIAADHYALLGSGLSFFGGDLGISFGLMAVVTAAAVVLSLRHGPAVAILGMLGGFMMPPLLVENTSPTLGMVLYLIAIEVGVLAVTGKRGWFGISLMTLIFSILWSVGYTLIGDNAHERTLTALLVLGTAGAYLLHTARIHRDPAASHGTRRRVLGLSIAATCSAIGVVALLAVKGGYAPRDLSMLGIVALGTLILARLDARQLAMPFVAMGLSLLVLFSNAAQSLPAPPSDTLVTMASCFGGLFLLGGYVCLWGSVHRRAFAVMCAIAGPGFYGVVLFAGHEAMGLREAWWPYTLGLAGVYVMGALPMLLRRKAEHDWSIALFSVLSFALVCIVLGQALDHPRFAVALALVSAVAALIDLRLFIRPLRVAGCVVALISAALLVVPGPIDLAIKGGPVFNTLLPMYALPALAFGIMAWAAGRAGSVMTARHLTWLCMATLAALPMVLIRDIFQPVNFVAEAFNVFEWSTYASVLLVGCFISHWLANRLGYEPIHQATRCCVGIAAVIALIGGLIPGNPLFQPGVAGGASLAAGLLALYAAPAALLWLWSRRASIGAVPALAELLRAVSITLLALFAALQVRNIFQADGVQVQSVGLFECATYGLVWAGLGLVLHLISPRCTLPKATGAAGRVVFGIGLMTLILGNVLILNPLWVRETVGSMAILNGLWYLYGPAILILALLARYARRQQQQAPAKLAGFTAIAISFMLLCMLIRHGFSGDGYALIANNLASSERYAYSLAWVLFGGALLIAGVLTRLDTLRYGSLAVLLLAIGKVFLIDTANLDNLYRVFSYFGLGVTLIGLGYLYQRLVFKRPGNTSESQAI